MRPHVVRHLRNNQTLSTRHYATFSNAVRKTTERVVLDSKPGDIYEFVREPQGLQDGVIKVKPKSFTCHWYWD